MLGHRIASVVIPTKNRPEFLARAAASVAAQTYRPLELIIVDDGSRSPVSADIVGPLDGVELKILRNAQSKGVSSARNMGARAAQGRFVAFLDDDDQWLADKLANQIDCILASDGRLGGCGCQMRVVDTEGRLIDEPVRSLKRAEIVAGLVLSDENIVPSTLLFERNKFLDLGGYREDMPVAEDCEFLLRFLLSHDFTVLPDRLVNFTEHGGERLTRNLAAAFEGEAMYLDFVVQNRAALGAGRRVVGYRHAKLGHHAMLVRKWGPGLRHFLSGMRLYPIDRRICGGMLLSLLGPQIYRRFMSLRMKRIR